LAGGYGGTSSGHGGGKASVSPQILHTGVITYGGQSRGGTSGFDGGAYVHLVWYTY
jgi:hypothetical protein